MTVVAREFRVVAVGLIDDPEIAMRETFDDEAFAELLQSIRDVGLQVPIIVEQRGERFRVIAGHRRITACRALDVGDVMCDVRQPGDVDGEAIKILENDDREKVNAAESAIYIHRLYTERCHNDVDEVCTLTRRSRRYIEDRLNLVIGDAEIFEAVKARQLSLSVAKELNGIKDLGYRRMHLDTARKFGMTTAAAKDARKSANFALEQGAKQVPAAGSADTPAFVAQPSQHACYICHSSDKPERMRYVVVHEFCDQFLSSQGVLAPFQQPVEKGTPNA